MINIENVRQKYTLRFTNQLYQTYITRKRRMFAYLDGLVGTVEESNEQIENDNGKNGDEGAEIYLEDDGNQVSPCLVGLQ